MRQDSLTGRLASAHAGLAVVTSTEIRGRVSAIAGMSVDIGGFGSLLGVGDRVQLVPRQTQALMAEVLGFRGGAARAMAFGGLEGVGLGSSARAPLKTIGPRAAATLSPSSQWLGRVIDPLGLPLDGRGALPLGGPA